jgi:hypothetical protein
MPKGLVILVDEVELSLEIAGIWGCAGYMKFSISIAAYKI